MEAEAIQKIHDLALAAAGKTVEIGGVTYATSKLMDPREPEPSPESLTIHTLTGFLDYHKSQLDELPDYAVHVVNPVTVNLISELENYHNTRHCYATALYWTRADDYLEKYMDVERFIVFLQSSFLETEDRGKVLSVVGNIKEEEVRATGDDGIAQSVTVKRGVVRVENTTVPNPVTLKPFRTFTEVDQPESIFILRMKEGDSGPRCALFEADGGKWRLDAIQNIRDYLRANLPETTVILA